MKNIGNTCRSYRASAVPVSEPLWSDPDIKMAPLIESRRTSSSRYTTGVGSYEIVEERVAEFALEESRCSKNGLACARATPSG